MQNHRSSSSGIQGDEQQMDSDLDFDIQHTVPQHRQYLNYDVSPQSFLLLFTFVLLSYITCGCIHKKFLIWNIFDS